MAACRWEGVPVGCLALELCASTSGAPGAPTFPSSSQGRGLWARLAWGGSWLRGWALAWPCEVRSLQRGKAWKPLASPCAWAAVPKKPLPRRHSDQVLVTPQESWGDPPGSGHCAFLEGLKCPRVGSRCTKETHFLEETMVQPQCSLGVLTQGENHLITNFL